MDATPLQDVMLEFRAGKMSFEGTRVVPDTRKGLIRIGRGEEGLIHFQWLDRTQNIIEDDQIIFPEEAVFEKVNQSSGRVYILKFSSDNRKFFFWMQEPRAEGDQDLCNTVNTCLNQMLDIMGEEDEVSVPVPEISEETADDELSSRAGNLVDQSMATDLTGEVSSSVGPVQLQDLQRILRSIQTPVEDPDARIGLGDILKPDLVSPLIESLPVEHSLASYLPEGSQSPADIIELIQSPPFRQQLETFTHVLRTGQIDLSQFGVDPNKFTVISFLEALEDSVAKASASGSVQEEKKNDPMDES